MGVRLVVHNYKIKETDYTGTHNHEEMIHRDWVNQHPIYAITGLQEVLNTIEGNIVNLDTAIIQGDKDTKKYFDDNYDILKTDINDKINALHTIDNVEDTENIDLTYDETTKTLKAEAIIYDDENDTNSLVSTPNGLYVPKDNFIDSDTVEWSVESFGESLKDIFTSGIRFSYDDKTWSKMADSSEANKWTWDDSKQSFVQPINTTTYNGFLTKNFYDNYEHMCTLKSSDADNDCNGVVIGYVEDENNRPRMLTAFIGRGDIPNGIKFGVAYNLGLPDYQLLTDHNTGNICSYNLLNSSGGWNTCPDGITLYIKKKKNIITVSTSPWIKDASNPLNNVTNIKQAKDMPFEFTFNIDLNDFSFGHYFNRRVRYGYSNWSQASSYFSDIFFISKESVQVNEYKASVKLHSEANKQNAIKVFDDGIYVKPFTISPDKDNCLEERSNGYYSKKFSIEPSTERLNGVVMKDSSHIYVHKSHSYVTVTQTKHNLAVGDFIYYSAATGYDKAIAKDSEMINIVGMVDCVYDEDNFEYICNGFVETDMFSSSKGFTQGLPLYISDIKPGSVTQEQPDISKAVGYPVENRGVIITIERGIQYNQEAAIGDFKQSANDYEIRSDGFIKVAENINYKLTLVSKLINAVSEDFKSKYMIIDTANNTMQFHNTSDLYFDNNKQDSMNLFIKAF